MSGGVDSSVAAALLVDQGFEVVGVTMKLWGGESDSGCCSVSDVDDARWVANQLDIEHHVFNFGDEFMEHVVNPFVDTHRSGGTPNPCIECNRHIKFDLFFQRASVLGFDRIATGHYAQIATLADGTYRMQRSIDPLKDQSYVLHMLGQDVLRRVVLPIGGWHKPDLRAEAERRGLLTAAKPDSQDVCFITKSGGREAFLGDRGGLTPGIIVTEDGRQVGTVPATELVTIGQRKGLNVSGMGEAHFVVDVDLRESVVTIGPRRSLQANETAFIQPVWAYESFTGPAMVQASAHGTALAATVESDRVLWGDDRDRIAPGQSLVFYDGDLVIGGAIAA
ncbi:MAG: tRNA-specific 2-thiouridylase [Verrucomicrobiales bacterium]|jgi:tRNA-specific 2-thiouridylase